MTPIRFADRMELVRPCAIRDLLRFGEGFDTAAFLRDEAVPKARVAFVPGATFYPVTQQSNHARLNYSGVSDDKILMGMTRLAALLRERLPG